MSLIAILEDLNVEKDKLEELKKPFIEKGHQFKEFNKTTDEDTYPTTTRSGCCDISEYATK